MNRSLQEGIYHAPGQQPGNSLVVMLLRCRQDASSSSIGASIGALWQKYQSLKQGAVPDLPGQTVPTGNLTVLIGFGGSVFDKFTLQRAKPETLQFFGSFLPPDAAGGGPILTGSRIGYASEVLTNSAATDLVVQFIADTQLAVNRAVVETWKFIADEATANGQSSFEIVDVFQGFQRDDKRSWIDFHDGVSNLESGQRAAVVTIKSDNAPISDDAWTIGGSYMAFARLRIDISVWRALSREQQELMVGRDKLTGCPLVQSPNDPFELVPIPGCPAPGTANVIEPGNEAFRETPEGVDLNCPLGQSHVHRANHHQDVPQSANSLRIYRQGFEFFERVASPPGFELGLNFVSFQDTSQRLLRLLTQPTWLGETNFGGDPNNPLPGASTFLRAMSAGIFLAPPVIDGELFPGASLFEQQLSPVV